MRLAPAAVLAVAYLASLVGARPTGGPIESARADVLATADELAPTIEEVGMRLWQIAEISLLEVESSAYLKGMLAESGFEITTEGAGGVPTAFVAEYGAGEPVLGIMLEYDALPDLGNAAVPRKEPREDGVTSGHACGHNLIAAAGIGTALTLKTFLDEGGISGTLRVFGGASEETEGAKVYMARDGIFDGVDAMLHCHPYDLAGVMNVRTAAQTQVFVEFTGKAAHAGGAPWEGRSALDAVELFLHSVNNMREHVKPTARIHYMIRNAGSAANIVPDNASVKLIFREQSRADVSAGVEWIQDMVQGAALMTQTEGICVPYYGMYDLLPNTPLAERMQQHIERVGIPTYTEEELEFARRLQTAAGVEPRGMATEIPPLPNEPTVGGSTDVGDVSWLTPTMGVVMPGAPRGIGVHTWMATASHGTSIGAKSAVMTTKVLALTGVDFLTDPEFRKQVRADFDRRTEGFEYVSPLPDELKEPVTLPEAMRSHGTIADVRNAILNQPDDHQHYPQGHDHEESGPR
ncbi:MAG: amidohydrolase [Planctomycetota bacterium]